MADVVLAKLESIGSETDVRGFHPPFSILYLADSLERAGFSVRLVHEEGTRANIQTLVDLVSEESPSFVGLSVVTGPSIIPSLQASMGIKDRCDVPIVWGGLQPTLLPELTLAKTCIDLLAIGEGEETVVELARVLSQHGFKPDQLADISGIAWKENGQVVFTKARPYIRNLDDISAAWHHLDIERYIRPEIYLASEWGEGWERATAINTSRGCPWRCGFCYNQAVNKRTFRAQSAARVIQDIENLKDRYDISGIRFSEDHFFSDSRRALEIIRNTGIPWSATIRVDDLTRGGESFVKELAENQCAVLRCGVESGSQRVLDLIHKDITLDQIREAADLCDKYGVRIGFLFLLGFPTESWAEVCQTLDLIDQLEGMSEHVMVALPAIFCPFPGTPLLGKAIEQGFEPPTTLEEWGNTIDVIVKNSGRLPPYVDERVERSINYKRLADVRDFDNLVLSLSVKVFRRMAKMRWKHRFFSFPVDWYIADLGRSSMQRLGKM
jgi:anaerobic magnesium-protoporphyrin IX monomethyl ester cyclase